MCKIAIEKLKKLKNPLPFMNNMMILLIVESLQHQTQNKITTNDNEQKSNVKQNWMLIECTIIIIIIEKNKICDKNWMPIKKHNFRARAHKFDVLTVTVLSLE